MWWICRLIHSTLCCTIWWQLKVIALPKTDSVWNAKLLQLWGFGISGLFFQTSKLAQVIKRWLDIWDSYSRPQWSKKDEIWKDGLLWKDQYIFQEKWWHLRKRSWLRKVLKSLIAWEPVDETLMIARFESAHAKVQSHSVMHHLMTILMRIRTNSVHNYKNW